jgi:MFS family permease
MIRRATSSGVPLSTMAVLMLSVFTVSMGFGVVLPLLPYLIERLLGTGVDAAQVSRSTGLLTGLYTLSLILFAPAWGACPTTIVAADQIRVRGEQARSRSPKSRHCLQVQ